MTTLRKFFSLILLLALAAGCAPSTPAPTATALPPSATPLPPSPTPYPAATITPTPVAGSLFVDPGKDLGAISPLVYGSNYGPWVAVPFDMLDAAFNSHVTVLRWPGGNWGDQNDIQPQQLDNFMPLLGKIGAIPTISVRLLNGSPDAAAALVKYANIQKGYKIRYWSIGNEPYYYAATLKQPYDTDRLNREWRAMALAMKAVDPTIQLIGPEMDGYTANEAANKKDSAGRDFMTEFLKANGDLTDIVSIHRYPYPTDTKGTPASIDQMRANSAEWDQTIPYLRDLIHRTTGRDIPIAVTEINSYWSPATSGLTTPDSFYNAIWYADVLGRLIKQNVFMVNMWLFADRNSAYGLVTGGKVHPTYYVFQMYYHFGSEQVYAASGVPNVSIYAAKRADGTLTLMVINMADTPQQVPLQVQGLTPGQAAHTWLFDASHNAEDIGATDLSSGKLSLPGQSISMFELAGK